MARRKFSKEHKAALSDVMRAVRARKAAGGSGKMKKHEKSLLSMHMKAHHARGKTASVVAHKPKTVRRKVSGIKKRVIKTVKKAVKRAVKRTPIGARKVIKRTTVTTKKRHGNAGKPKSAAHRAAISAAHKARHAKRKSSVTIPGKKRVILRPYNPKIEYADSPAAKKILRKKAAELKKWARRK